MGIFKAGLSNGRGVDYRQHFFDVIQQNPVKKGQIAIHQSDEENILFNIGRFSPKIFKNALNLFLNGKDRGRQKSFQAKGLAFRHGEGCALVEMMVMQKVNPLGDFPKAFVMALCHIFTFRFSVIYSRLSFEGEQVFPDISSITENQDHSIRSPHLSVTERL
jgi:hypothetical protein